MATRRSRGGRVGTRLLTGSALALAGFVPLADAGAATCDVPSGAYPTLQSAVSDTTCDVVRLAPGTYDTTSFSVATISRDVTVRGVGDSKPVIDAEGAAYGLFIASNDVFLDVVLERLVVTNADTAGISSEGNLTVRNVVLRGNEGNGLKHQAGPADGGMLRLEKSVIRDNDHREGDGTTGGGIELLNVDARITNTKFTGNRADSGAAISIGNGPRAVDIDIFRSTIKRNAANAAAVVNASSAARVTVTESAVSRNSGIGLYAYGGTIQLFSSTVALNDGGGVHGAGGSRLVIKTSTIAGNTGAFFGGGIYAGGEAMISRSTIRLNESDHTAGGIRSDGPFTMINSTVTENSTNGSYAGIELNGEDAYISSSTITANVANADDEGSGTVGGINGSGTVRNSIVATNYAFGQTSGHDCLGGPWNWPGVSLIEDATYCQPGDNEITFVDPFLYTAANFGGPTFTQRLSPSSPAVDRAGSGCPAIDQRGVPREDCDIGAYELVYCNEEVVNRVGTAGRDVLRGTAERDGIISLGGNDRIDALGGPDGICAGGGDDRVEGGEGNDVLAGQDGADDLYGQGGNDTLRGGNGNDLCAGGPGSNDLMGCER